MQKCERCQKEHNGKFATGRFCSRKCSNSKNHSPETRKKISAGVRCSDAYKNGTLSKKGFRVPRFSICCNTCKKDFFSIRASTKFCSRDCSWKSPTLGGYREGSGHSKSGWYFGIYCGSSWELAFLIWALEHQLPIQRCTIRFLYEFNGKKKTYLPDFIINDIFIEIKGFDTPQTQAKTSQCDATLIVLHEHDLKHVFDYVKTKYGNDFIKLYDGNPHNLKNNKCKQCNELCKNIYCSRKCSMIGNHHSKFVTLEGAAPSPSG